MYNPVTMLKMNTEPRVAKKNGKPGFIPAVYYGAHAASTPIYIDAIEFGKILSQAGESSSIVLTTEHGDENAMIQDVQLDPVRSTPIHADFYIIEKGQKVDVKTPIVFTGESQAVKEGGVLVKVLHELSIIGEPNLLPHEFIVDISPLVTQDSVIKVSDIVLPAGVELYHIHGDDIVASIAQAEEIVEEVAPAPDLSAIEVEQKGKKEEDGGEGEAGDREESKA